jgi:hypothetical protein
MDGKVSFKTSLILFFSCSIALFFKKEVGFAKKLYSYRIAAVSALAAKIKPYMLSNISTPPLIKS